jgi:phage gp29-like protein
MFGFQPIEVIWGRVGNYILPTDLVPKNQEWFLYDKNANLRLASLNNNLSGEVLPDKKFLTPTYNDINNKYYNPYGDRVLSSCFWPVTFKKSGFKWWVTFAEKYGMPYIIGKLPRSTMDSDRESMKNQLEAMVMDAVAVISDDAQLDFIEPGGRNSSSDLYDHLITACDHSISKAILGQTLTTDGNQKGTGSYALGKVHAGVRRDIIYSDKKIVERTHNQLIKWIWEINFNSGEIPRFSMFEEENIDKTLAERDEILVKQGIKFAKSYYIKNYGLSNKDFEVKSKDSE